MTDLEKEVDKDKDEEESDLVKSIPVEHFLVNLNFLAASKLIK